MIFFKSSKHQFSIAKIIPRLLPKRHGDEEVSKEQVTHGTEHEKRPPLAHAPLPLVMPQHQQSLSTLGWTTITFPQPSLEHGHGEESDVGVEYSEPGFHPLQAAYEQLFEASQRFFAEPDAEKQKWKHKLGSEEGWSKIAGEKEFITLRSLEYCPEILRRAAKQYWDLMGAHLCSTLSCISKSLGLPNGQEEGLQRFVGPCRSMQALDELKTATMLRLFRYEGWNAKVVAEPHADLGLLSIVVGNVPGLEVWDGRSWFPVEQEVEKADQKGASLLVGRELERLSNGRYPAGGHRVVSYASPEHDIKASSLGAEQKNYRFSIVFVLRAHEAIVIDSEKLETDITGQWRHPVRDTTVERFYEEIRARYFNINIEKGERERQRRNVAARVEQTKTS